VVSVFIAILFYKRLIISGSESSTNAPVSEKATVPQLKQSLPIYPLTALNFFLLMNQNNIVRTSSMTGVKPTYFQALLAPKK